ncbi:MAG: glycosyltransferase family 4 protein [Planctomycetes bacterium]|nr:glycosyltransferase family 4 protein [Planctomycetota bacterium]
MIALLEPARRDGQCSGGYRFQDEIGRRLLTSGRGRQLPLLPSALPAAAEAAAARGEHLVLDGLFAALGCLPPSPPYHLLLHTPLPAELAAAWLPRCRSALVTAPGTARTLPDSTRVAVVEPGLDPCFVPHPLPRSPDAPIRLICVGAITRTKRQLELLELLAAVRPATRPIGLRLLGDTVADPDYAAATTRRAAELGIDCAFACESEPRNVAAHLQAADLCVSMSRSESFGMAVAEALACGVPVLAFATGQFAAWIAHERNGWLFALGDHAGLAARLAILLADPSHLLRARSLARRPPLPDWNAVTERFVAAVQQDHLTDPPLPT